MKKIAGILLSITLFFVAITVIPSFTYATGGTVSTEDNVGAFEEAFTDLFLGIGDFLANMINTILAEKVTMQDIVFNNVLTLNPNFFYEASTLAQKPTDSATYIMRATITNLYTFFSTLAILVYLIAFLVMGTKIVWGSTAGGMQKAKELFSKWLIGLLMLFFFPNVVVRYAFILNEAIVEMLEEQYNGVGNVGTYIGTPEGEWSAEEIEFRSPEYVSRFTGIVDFGGKQSNIAYQKALNAYKAKADLTRIMRAYAGISKKFIYVIIWIVLLSQLFVLVIQYYKRYFVIAILLVIFPLVTIAYIIEIIRGKNGQVFSEWAKEMFVNIFVQSVHAIVYVVIASVAIAKVTQDISSAEDSMNWLLIIVAINFITEGEKIVRKLLGINSKTSGGIADMGKSVKDKVKGGAGGAGRVGRAFAGGGKK